MVTGHVVLILNARVVSRKLLENPVRSLGCMEVFRAWSNQWQLLDETAKT